MYSEFACIVDYLVEKYGKEKLLVYMKNLTKGNDHDTIFRQIYGTDFERMLVDFRIRLLNAESETTDINKQPASSNEWKKCRSDVSIKICLCWNKNPNKTRQQRILQWN